MPTFRAFEAWSDRRTRRRLETLYLAIVAGVLRLIELEADRDETQARLRATVESNPADYDAKSAVSTATMIAMLAAIPAAVVTDFFLLSSLIRMLSNGSVPADSPLMWAARLAIPVSIVVTEIAGSTALTTNYERRRWGKFALWLGLAVFICAAVPAAYVGAAYARHDAALAAAGAEQTAAMDQATFIFGLMPKIFWPTFTITVIALVVHGGLLIGGAEAHAAKAALIYRWRKARLGARERAIRTSIRTAGASVAGTFRTYGNLILEHNARSLRPANPGPFPAHVAEWLNRYFRQTVIHVPTAAIIQPDHEQGAFAPESGRAGDDSTATPLPAADAGLEAELEYLRTLQERRIRDDESEVRP